MEEVWERLHALESQILAHNEEVDKISPKKVPLPGTDLASIEQSLLNPETRSRSNSQLLELRKEAKEKEFKIAQLERDLASLESVKDQNQNLKAQVALLTEKLRVKEQELKEKDDHLKELEGAFKPTLASYESELSQLRSLSAALQKELSASRQELVQKEILVADLAQTNANKDERSALISHSKSEAERQVEALSSVSAKLQDEVVAMTQSLRDKELIVDTLEDDNNKLRVELQKALEALQQCQSELKLIPKLKTEVTNCEQLISAASGEIEENRTAISRLMEERTQYITILDDIKQLTEEADPVDFIHTLQSQLLESTTLLGQAKAELSKRENAYRELQQRGTKAVTVLAEAFGSFARALQLEGLPVLPKLAILPEGFRELVPICDQFRADLESFRGRCVDKIRELENLLIDNDAKAGLFEDSQKSLKSRLEDLSTHISEQESLYHALSREKERTETELLRQLDTLKATNQQSNLQMEQLRSVAERLSKAVQPLLSEALIYPSDSSSRDLPSAIQLTISTLHRLDSRVRDLEAELQEAQRTSLADKAALEDCSRSYAVRFQDMSRQIRDLTSAIDQSEDSSKGIVERYKRTSEDLQTAHVELDRTKETLITTQITCKQYVTLIEMLVYCLGKSVHRYREVSGLKRVAVQVWATDMRNITSERVEMEELAGVLGVRRQAKAPVARVRTAAIAVLAVMRLWHLCRSRDDATERITLKGVTFPMLKKHFLPAKLPRRDSPLETLQGLLALYDKASAEDSNLTRLSSKLLFGLTAAQRKHPSSHFSPMKQVKEQVFATSKRLQSCEAE